MTLKITAGVMATVLVVAMYLGVYLNYCWMERIAERKDADTSPGDSQ
jgi:hypothetical protein